MAILCKLMTRGKHKFVLVNHRYRCRYCGILRSRVLWKPKPVKAVEVEEVTNHT